MTKSLFAIFAVTALSATSMYGQDEIRVTIPFDFAAGGHELPAGEYRVHFSYSPTTVWFKNTDSNAALVSIAHAASAGGPADSARLVFHKYGDRYFLSQVFKGGANPGAELPRSHEELEQIAVRHASKTVTIAAMVR